MRNALFVALFFIWLVAHGQKVVKKTFLNAETSTVQIDAANCFEIKLTTGDSNELIVTALIDGEYSKDLVVNIEQKGQTAAISAGFHPNFIRPNDKLSAHKVVSIALDIELPERKEVALFGTNSNVLVTGVYRRLNIVLNDGWCRLDQVSEMTEVATQSGDIILFGDKAKIKAESKFGSVAKNTIPKGDDQFILSSITGNIQIHKTE